MYRYITTLENQIIEGLIFRISDNTIIPFDPSNTSYQKYLTWLAAGNEPLPADDPS